jgi:uncharacterized protein
MDIIKNYIKTYKSLFNLEKITTTKFVFLFNVFCITVSASTFFQFLNKILFKILDYTMVNANTPPVDSFEILGWYVLSILIIAPISEELIFRLPLTEKFMRVSQFSIVLLSSLFAIIHIFNFTNYLDGLDSLSILVRLLFAPIILLPYFIIGILLSMTRIKLGITYSILLHSAINFSAFGAIIFATSIGSLLKIDYFNIYNLINAALITLFLLSLPLVISKIQHTT